MARLKRYDIKKLLQNPDLRRKLIVDATIATQAREGIDVSKEDAENSYYVVSEGERAAFFGLSQFRSEAGENDGRHIEFVKAVSNLSFASRIDVSLKDFESIESSPLAYDKVALVGRIFQDFPRLDPTYCDAKQGLISTESERFVRVWWEVSRDTPRRWVPYAKGGDYCRFYSDLHLRFDWTSDGKEIKEIARERYGSASRTIKCEEYYFRPGITWVEKTVKGMNARLLPAGAIFNVAGPSAFPHKEESTLYLLGILNSTLSQYILNALATRSWGVDCVGKLPIPLQKGDSSGTISEVASSINRKKEEWDTGNEICTRFDHPWSLRPDVNSHAPTLATALDAVLDHEAKLDAELESTYAALNDAVYRLYGVNEKLREKLEAAIGKRPPEIVWPQMENKDRDQKRREHVDRLLLYLVKRVVEADEDGLVCFESVDHEKPLLERLRHELHAAFPAQDPAALETEVINELKKKTKGYRRAESLTEWLQDAFFETHCRLYQQRPLIWHLASDQVRRVPAFGILVHAHKFNGDSLAKLRGTHLRDRIAILRREAGQASQDGREDDRLEALAAVEEAEAYDEKLKRLQDGFHPGPFPVPDQDYRILTPWKSESERPKGWHPDLDDGIKVNIAPLGRTGLLRIKGRFSEKEIED